MASCACFGLFHFWTMKRIRKWSGRKQVTWLKKRPTETTKRSSKLLGLSSLEKEKLEGLATEQISNKAPHYSTWGDQLFCCGSGAMGEACMLLQHEEQGLAIKKDFLIIFFLWGVISLGFRVRQAQVYFPSDQASIWKHRKNELPAAASVSNMTTTSLIGFRGPAR